MLQNAHFLANIGADTAENEQHMPKFAILRPPTLWLWARLGVRALQRRFGFPEVDAAGPQVLRDGHLILR